MTSSQNPGNDAADLDNSRAVFNARARSGTVWIIAAFGTGQLVRLGLNIVLAALLFEEAFALMALVTAVIIGLTMFSDIGLQQNVVQSPRGDDEIFLNTAWTLQVIRGIVLTLMAALMAWPLSVFYGTNDPAALELRWLIPLAALTAVFDGLRSPRMLSAARHMRVAQLTRIEVLVTVVNTLLMFGLTWHTRSVYAIALAAVISAAVHCVMSYFYLPGARARFVLEPAALHSIFSFGKWIFLSTLTFFFATQIDRFAFSAIYPLADVGVYSISAGLAMLIPMVMGRLQSAIVFPWYARMLESGSRLTDAFSKAQKPVLVASTYLVVLLIVGADSFFELAYDDRYAKGAAILPVLAFSIWFNNLASLYGSAFLVKGLSQWSAAANAAKVMSFVLLFGLLSQFETTVLEATLVVLASDMITACVSRYLGWRLGLRKLGLELGMLAMLLGSVGLCLALTYIAPPIANAHPAWRLMILGVVVTTLFIPLFLKLIYPIIKPNSI